MFGGIFRILVDDYVKKSVQDLFTSEIGRTVGQVDLCRSLTTISSFDDLLVDRSDFEKKTGEIQIQWGDVLGEGTYGIAYAAKHNGRDIVVKEIKEDERIEVNKEDVMREVYAHITLFCGSTTNLIVEPFFAVRNLMRYYPFESWMIGMDRLDVNMSEFFEIKNNHVKNRFERDYLFTLAILDIANGLIELQEKFKFVHGDMHSGNVMVRYRNKERPSFHLIDFGYSMLNFSFVKTPSNRMPRNARLSVGWYGTEDVVAFNPSHDLLQLLLHFFLQPSSSQFGNEVDTAIHDVYKPIYDNTERLPSVFSGDRTFLRKRLQGAIDGRNDFPFYHYTIHIIYPPSVPTAVINTFSAAKEKLDSKRRNRAQKTTSEVERRTTKRKKPKTQKRETDVENTCSSTEIDTDTDCQVNSDLLRKRSAEVIDLRSP